MNHKVLLADDSLTIQKVIKITLANQPYDISDASSEEELFNELSKVQPKLVFLDFNLSEKYTGYELTTKIKSLVPSAKVLLLLGTFDTVDEAAMEKCGASDKIVKPFDSNKFIAICKQLIDTFADSNNMPYPEAKAKNTDQKIDLEDQWRVSHSIEQKFNETKSPLENKLPVTENPLIKEVSDWGMNVPGVINQEAPGDKMFDLPPVIGELKNFSEKKQQRAETHDQKFPNNSDLDYPTIEEMELEKPTPTATSFPKSKPASKLISIDGFNDRFMDLELEGSYVPDETDVKSIEAQIRDEVEENLWHVDEFEDLKKEVSAKIEEVKSNFQPTRNDFDESLFRPIDDQDSITWQDTSDIFKEETKEEAQMSTVFFAQSSHSSGGDVNELRSDMEEMVKKYVKQYLDEMFKKGTEKVAWEVIPDLAENLIRQELSKISHKILHDQS